MRWKRIPVTLFLRSFVCPEWSSSIARHRADRERFTTPFINDVLVEKLFGANSADVKNGFLNPRAHGTWSLKSGFSTQSDIMKIVSRASKIQDF